MKSNAVTVDDQIRNLVVASPDGLTTPQLLERIRPRISQPTLWRAISRLRVQGVLICQGRARSSRYHARARTDLPALRSLLMHTAVASRLLREPAIRLQALERLQKLRSVNPQGQRYHDRWEELLHGPVADTVRAMTEVSESSDALRKESPWTVFVSPQERKRIFGLTGQT